MKDLLKWVLISTSVIFIILSIVMTVLYFKKSCPVYPYEITKLDLIYSPGNNTGLKNDININAFLMENILDTYLFIPGFGTQNKLIFRKLSQTDTNPTSIKSNPNEKLKKYSVESGQIPGYFNNCGNNNYGSWTLVNGVLTCTPTIWNGTAMASQEIQLKNCGGSAITVGNDLPIGFGSTVIKLKKI